MFTGLIETIGKVSRIRERGNYRVLTIASSFGEERMSIGDSICCDGACLTVTETTSGAFVVEASQETAARTILADYSVGAKINLERALRADARLGGHLVAGHVDDTGVVEKIRAIGESLELTIAYKPEYDPYVVEKGSIAVNGLSLTVNEVTSGRFTVNLIPQTLRMTTMAELTPGCRVNLEFDLIGKYIVKLSHAYQRSGITMDKLIESGW